MIFTTTTIARKTFENKSMFTDGDSSINCPNASRRTSREAIPITAAQITTPTGSKRERPAGYRLLDFFDLRSMVCDYFNHISYDLKRLDCLFCTRKNARWRKTVNEDEAIEWLSSKYETKVFEPENLSIKQQLELLGKAKFFFGAGASIPMTMFSPHDSVLFEIRPPQGHGVVGRCWADMFRLGYHRVAVDVHGQEVQEDIKNKRSSFHEKDLIIDMDKFKKDVSEIVKMTELF